MKIHATFLLIVVLGAMQWSTFGLSGMAFGALLTLALFVCVTLHEFGHGLVAQRFGISVREIVLLPIGGVAAPARNPSKPLHELLIAAAGSTYTEEQARSVLSAWHVGDAYNKHALTLTEHDRLSRVVDYLLTSYQPDFAVWRGRELVGVVLREKTLEALRTLPVDTTVDRLMLREVPRIRAETTLTAVTERMREVECRVAAVYHGSRFAGLVSADDLAEAHLVLTFVRREANGRFLDGSAGGEGLPLSPARAGRPEEMLSGVR